MSLSSHFMEETESQGQREKYGFEPGFVIIHRVLFLLSSLAARAEKNQIARMTMIGQSS